MASPSRPTPSRSTSRHTQYQDAEDEPQLQQAGRSSTNLAAQVSARSLREQSRPNTLKKKDRSQTPTQPPMPSLAAAAAAANTGNIRGDVEARSQDSTARQSAPARQEAIAESSSQDNPIQPSAPSRQETIPPVPSTSIPTPRVGPPRRETPSTSTRSSDEDAGSSSSDPSDIHIREASTTATPAGMALAAEMQLSPSGTGAQTPTSRMPLFQSMSYNNSSLSLTRVTTPRSVRDLGSDYTRYYNPFASRNNSTSDLLSLPRNNTSTTHLSPGVPSADLHQRLSNPFHDTKRYSNPFESRPPTAPGTPHTKQSSVDDKKLATTMAVPIRSASANSGIAMATPAAPLSEKPGTPIFIRDADPEKAAFFPYLDDRLGAPEYAFPLFTDEIEDDDDLHMPQWDDDIRLKPKFKDHFTRDNLASTLGMIFMICGLLCVFVVLPIVSYTGTNLIGYEYETPLDELPDPDGPQAWATVNDVQYPLFQNLRSSLIDEDTPKSAMTRQGVDGDEYKLVFSDEFNAQNRTFYPGDDPYWYAFDGWYGATEDIEWYDPDAANTGDGTLQLQLDAFHSHNLPYRSGMLHSWNQLCFKGGIFEVSMSLPGPAGVHGWWPGVWTMGNLGRPGYLATTDGMWPYTYNDCDAGITPNQSMTDGTSHLPGQRLPSCTCANEDHPTPGTGRGAPEIDIAEASADYSGNGWGVATQSYQVAPFDVFYYPNYEFMETPNYGTSFVNTYTGGPFQQAVSTTSILNNNWYDGNQYQKYAFEYAPGGGKDAFVAWIIGEEETMRFDGRAIGPNGNVGQRLISEEPMSMILNFGFSHAWTYIDWSHLEFPATMRIDYVRWYQKEGSEMVTCDPPGYETTEYIARHPNAYNNQNYTHWADAGYAWPKNTLMNGCSA